MAVMIPEIPNPFQPGSLEDVMFEALRACRIPGWFFIPSVSRT